MGRGVPGPRMRGLLILCLPSVPSACPLHGPSPRHSGVWRLGIVGRRFRAEDTLLSFGPCPVVAGAEHGTLQACLHSALSPGCSPGNQELRAGTAAPLTWAMLIFLRFPASLSSLIIEELTAPALLQSFVMKMNIIHHI